MHVCMQSDISGPVLPYPILSYFLSKRILYGIYSQPWNSDMDLTCRHSSRNCPKYVISLGR